MDKVRLGTVMTLHRGYDLPNAQRKSGDVPVISSSGISGSHSVAKLVGENVITGRYGTIGEVFYHNGPCWPLNTTLFVEDFHGNDPKYVAYLLEVMLNALQIDGTDKSTVPGVDRNVLHDLVVPYISDLASQKTTTRVLSAIDAKIANNKKLIAELEETARLIYDYWFTQFDFPDENGRPYRSNGGTMVWSDELKREIPKGWSSGTLGDYLHLKKDTIIPAAAQVYEHYSIPAYDDEKYPSLDDGSSIESGKYRVEKGCILYSKLNPKFKRLWRPYCLTDNAICSTEFLVMQPNRESEQGFVLGVLHSDSFYSHMVSRATSSTGSRSRVDPEAAVGFTMPRPGDRLIERYENVAMPLYNQIQQLEIEGHELASLRNWLLPMLMNGQLVVE